MHLGRVVVVVLGLVACSPVTILHISDTPNGGIGFFPLVAVNQEVLQYQQKWLKVDITVSETFPVNDTTWKDATTVTSFFVCGADQPALDNSVTAVRAALKDVKREHVAVVAAVGKAVALAEGACSSDPPLWRSPAEVVANHVPVSDVRTIEQVVATEMKYLNVDAPYGGSGSAAVKLDPRGTLTEASVARQDQMPPALAGAVGTVLAAGLTAGGTVLGGLIKTDMNAANFTETPPPPPPHPRDPVVLSVSIATTLLSRTYKLTVIWPLKSRSSSRFTTPDPNPCLSLTSYSDHTNDCIDNVAVANDAIPSPSPPAAPSAPTKPGS
jgi:hypothetical protein